MEIQGTVRPAKTTRTNPLCIFVPSAEQVDTEIPELASRTRVLGKFQAER